MISPNYAECACVCVVYVAIKELSRNSLAKTTYAAAAAQRN